MDSWLVNMVGVLVGGGAIGFIGTLVTNRTEKDKNRSADWQGYADRLEKRITALTERLDSQEKRSEEMQAEIDSMKAERISLRSLIDDLVAHVHAWRLAFPDRDAWPGMSDRVRDELAT